MMHRLEASLVATGVMPCRVEEVDEELHAFHTGLTCGWCMFLVDVLDVEFLFLWHNVVIQLGVDVRGI